MESKKWNRGIKNASIDEMSLKYLCEERALKSDRT